jgi:flagellar basal body-associated protein FliL
VRTSTLPDPVDAALWANLTPATQRRGRGNPWVILGVLVVVMLVAIMVLALVASHLTHTTHPGSAEVARQTVSRLRL